MVTSRDFDGSVYLTTWRATTAANFVHHADPGALFLDNRTLSSYSSAMRRRAGSLVPLEIQILDASAELARAGQPEVHGYQLARMIQDSRHARRLTAYGTLYKALTRLQRAGYLASRWEDPDIAVAELRPRRRFYRMTLEGDGALADARRETRPDLLAGRPAAARAR
jgi:DNA-binding PadR family transcriptional regulator